MALPSLRRESLVALVTQQLQEQVARGTWPVGKRIPAETELAERLGVGRSTIREAIRALVQAGLLEPRQGAGTFVRGQAATVLDWNALVRRAAVLEVYEVRQGLERQAAVLAAQRRSPADIEHIDAALARRQQARRRAHDDAFISADLDFHQAVIAAAHNELLDQMFASFVPVLRDALAVLIVDTEPAPAETDTSDAHDALAEAIRAGDPAAAVEATEANLDVTAKALRQQLYT